MIGISEVALKGMNYCCRPSAGSGRQNGVDEFTLETLLLRQARVFLGRLSDLGHSPRKRSARAGEARRLEGKATLLCVADVQSQQRKETSGEKRVIIRR